MSDVPKGTDVYPMPPRPDKQPDPPHLPGTPKPLAVEADLLEQAWTIIACAGIHRGGWDAQHAEWVDAAIRYRGRYFAYLHNHGGWPTPADPT